MDANSDQQSVSDWAQGDFTLNRPNPARIFNYLLGGFHNFEIDRKVADGMISIYPDVLLSSRAGRACLVRMVKFLATAGIDQFLDIGSGLPSGGNVHEVAQLINPQARVVYVDVDPVAVAHSQAILKENPNAIIIQGDLTQPQQILNHAELQAILDFQRPLGLTMHGVVHYIPDDELALRSVRELVAALSTGSYLALAHATFEGAPPGILEQISQLYSRSTAQNKVRTPQEIRKYFDGLILVDPGLVPLPLWRPDGPDDIFLQEPGRSFALCAIGQVP